MTQQTLEALQFDNRFVRELPGDPLDDSRPRQVLAACWSPVRPTPVAAPHLLALWAEVAELIDLDPAEAERPLFAEVFAGNQQLAGMQPYAACYGGHQFGHWAGQLGDGRAISLGEVLTNTGQRWELQLKGAGPTPYARRADGRAVLRSSLREFLCSEAMYHLGVPTTRALSLVATGEPVLRDMFYDGNPQLEPGAVVCRVAPSFIRFGNFEIFTARRDYERLAQLVDFTITRDFPELTAEADPLTRYSRWFREVCERTAVMVAHWMRVGFVHGVMNTDNMSILGLTIDYGPYGWLDNFDPDWTPNTTDAEGRRYRFGQQPMVAQWNLACLGNALAPLFPASEPLEAGLEHFGRVYGETSRILNAAKLGLSRLDEEGTATARAWYALLQQAELDLTISFRALAELDPAAPSPAIFAEAWYSDELRATHEPALQAWLIRYAALVRADPIAPLLRKARMHAANPLYVPRNYLAQQAIDALEQGDLGPLQRLMQVLRHPYEEQPASADLAGRRPAWAKDRAGCSMLSCSS